jgi:hypothetical protein
VTLRSGTAYPPTTVDVRYDARQCAGGVGARGACAADEPTDETRASPRSVQYKETIGDLKARVAAKTGVPVEKQQVRCVGRALRARVTAPATACSSSGTARSW